MFLARRAGFPADVIYSGGVGRDEIGAQFADLLETEGVVPRLSVTDTPTGSSVILVTPDGQRTMFTYLGACRNLTRATIDMDLIGSVDIFHTTGYMWDTPNQAQAARAAVNHARAAGTRVSFDVADSFVVERFGDSLRGWIPGNVDLLFANASELRRLTETEGEDAAVLSAATAFAPVVVMKNGKKGCMLCVSGLVSEHAATPAAPLDTTAAGDAFAAGFLSGLIGGADEREAADHANIVAGAIVTVEGCDYAAIDAGTLLEGAQALLREGD